MRIILTIALNPAIDINTSVGSLQPERKMRCSAPAFEAGGGAVNVARVVSALSGHAMVAYFEGGPTGQKLTTLLEKEGISSLPVPVKNETRENFNVTDLSNNRQYRFIMPGKAVSNAECRKLLNAVRKTGMKAGYFVLSGSFPPGIPSGFFRELNEIADRAGARVIVDTSGEALRQAVDLGVYLIKPNIGELAALTGRDQLLEEEAVEAAREIISAGGAKVVVVSLGEAGALLVTGEMSEKIPAPLVKRISTVGAGDSMVAGIALGLQRGLELKEVVRFGVACGTAATLNPGTAGCKKADAEKLYKNISHKIHSSIPGINVDEQFL